MVKVKIDYYFWTATDIYVRYIGRSVDSPLNSDFWVSQPDKVIGVAQGSYFYSEEIDLKPGEHYVECRTSGYALPPHEQYKWFVKVLVNGKEIGSDSCGRDKVAKFTFSVTNIPIPSIPKEFLPIIGLAIIGGIVGVVTYLAWKERS